MKLARAFTLSLFLIALRGMCPAFADPQIEVALKPSRTLRINQTCQLLLQVSWKTQEADYHFLEPDLRVENFTVEETGESTESIEKQGETWRKREYRFSLKPLRPGKGKISQLVLRYVDPLSQKGGRFESPPLEVQIVPDHEKLYRGGGIGLAAIGLAGGILLIVRRRTITSIPPVVTELTPEDRCLGFFQKLAQETDPQISSRAISSQAEKYLKDYVMEKWDLKISGTSRPEFEHQLKGKLAPEEFKTLSKIFDKLEQWRYAETPVFPAESRKLLNEMIQFIEGKRTVTY